VGKRQKLKQLKK